MSSWHERMADAVRLRQKAVNGVARWQEKLAEAEAVIETLSNERQGIIDTPAAAVFDAPAPQISNNLHAVFGPTESA